MAIEIGSIHSASINPDRRSGLESPRSRDAYRVAVRALTSSMALPILAASLAWLAATAAGADGLRMSLDCPETVIATTAPQLNIQVENRDCSPRNVRILSTLIGNGAESVGGVSVIGPEIAASNVLVPAAVDQLSGLCINNICEGVPFFCQSNADCACVFVTPTIVDVPVTGPTPIPIEFTDTFVEQFAFADSDLDSTPIGGSCLIEVPEPGFESIIWPLLLLTALVLRRPPRAAGSA